MFQSEAYGLERIEHQWSVAATTPQANALIGVFLAEQMVKKAAAAWEKKGTKQVNQAAVLGAGIMGGGIAYQSAVKGLPIVMKSGCKP